MREQMRSRIFLDVLYGFLLSLPVIGLGVLIALFLLKDKASIDITLFVLGGLPIVIFLPSVISKSKSGALHTPKVIYRKVDTLERREEDHGAGKSGGFSELSFVIAGLVTWLTGYLIALFLA